jgi:hypothetical protein
VPHSGKHFDPSLIFVDKYRTNLKKNFFTDIINECMQYAGVFVPDKSFQPSLIFVGETLEWSTLKNAPVLLTNIRLGWKGLPGKNTLVDYEHS